MGWRAFTGYIPVVVAMVGLLGWGYFRPSWKGQRPVKEKLLRGPGESLRLKLDDLNDKLILPIAFIVSLAAGLGPLTATLPTGWTLFAVWGAALAVFGLLSSWL